MKLETIIAASTFSRDFFYDVCMSIIFIFGESHFNEFYVALTGKAISSSSVQQWGEQFKLERAWADKQAGSFVFGIGLEMKNRSL